MSLSQKPIHGSGFSDQSRKPAWKTKPSWYQVSDRDNMIPPETEQEMAEKINSRKIVHLDAGHASLASHPEEVTNLILEAAEAVVK
ncbi:Alpha/beta hydrolase family protein [compost metagenome]